MSRIDLSLLLILKTVSVRERAWQAASSLVMAAGAEQWLLLPLVYCTPVRETRVPAGQESVSRAPSPALTCRVEQSVQCTHLDLSVTYYVFC